MIECFCWSGHDKIFCFPDEKKDRRDAQSPIEFEPDVAVCICGPPISTTPAGPRSKVFVESGVHEWPNTTHLDGVYSFDGEGHPRAQKVATFEQEGCAAFFLQHVENSSSSILEALNILQSFIMDCASCMPEDVAELFLRENVMWFSESSFHVPLFEFSIPLENGSDIDYSMIRAIVVALDIALFNQKGLLLKPDALQIRDDGALVLSFAHLNEAAYLQDHVIRTVKNAVPDVEMFRPSGFRVKLGQCLGLPANLELEHREAIVATVARWQAQLHKFKFGSAMPLTEISLVRETAYFLQSFSTEGEWELELRCDAPPNRQALVVG